MNCSVLFLAAALASQAREMVTHTGPPPGCSLSWEQLSPTRNGSLAHALVKLMLLSVTTVSGSLGLSHSNPGILWVETYIRGCSVPHG